MVATFRGRLTAGMSAVSLGVLALASVLIYAGLHWALVRSLCTALSKNGQVPIRNFLGGGRGRK